MVAGALRDARPAASRCGSPTTPTTTSAIVPPPPRTKPELIESLPFPTAGIPGIPDLMHHKYVVRDGESVWTGSTNWTVDSWTLQENVIVGARLAAARGRVRRRTSRSSGASATSTAPATRTRARFPSTGCRCAPGSRPDTARSCRTGSPQRDRAGARARADRLAGAHGGAGDRNARPRSPRRRRWTCAAWSTAPRSSRSSSSGATTGARPGRSRSLASRARARRLPRQALDALHARERPRLHAREGDGRRRRVFVGSFNLSRSGERNAENVLEVAGRRRWPTGWPPTSTRSGHVTNG